jgi:DNA-binding LacI/PurR family transcriptional regulator
VNLAEREREMLRALCAGEIVPQDRARAMQELARHAWSEGEHRVVYEALGRAAGGSQATGSANSARARLEGMAAAATRAGFPDVSWEEYFLEDGGQAAAKRYSAEALAEMIRSLGGEGEG